ncbi:A disintegrin and metalloproteinase with thrombospondin motifs 17 [Grammomys surdaster]|uniref:A disintegrin and metalloproteinase with thrombospondin motifs 17 n=1 Tax=Grammomys surdaster TaxID=491861 RepID=UPI00109FFF61|nr:A disintegrin and metalloproteinase with thrombospondin motifs 17 [Grammomys surdaster]
MCDGTLLPPLVLSLLLLVWGLDPGTAVGDAAADVEVVLPRRLRPDDVHLQLLPGAAGLRRWRRPRASPGGPRAGQGERALLLHLPAFGRDLYLQLRRDLRFLSPGFEVEEAGVSGRSGHPAELCFYSGRVLGHPGSLVSLSACGAAGGLVGLIQLEQEQVFIQPLNNSGGPFSGREHLIRRKWSSTPTSSTEVEGPKQRCKVVTEKKKPRKGKLSQDWRERRNAIRLTNEHTVETLVVADADMVQYHGAEAAQRFILTVMNMVYNMFQHHSLGIKINIQVTKLVLLRQRPAKLSIGHHGERSLESFCHWQNEEYGGARYLGNNQVPGGKDDTPPVDAAVFVTRTDFCVHKDEPCDTVGIAYLGGMCSAERKCVLAEDNGLNLAFTIAHELGHNLGMNHDDDHSSCAGRSHIMSGEWVKGRNPSDLSWSSCSRDDLENFLKSKVSTCLLITDPRSQHALRLPHKLPGMHYSANEQCQILFGTNATFCKNMEVLLFHDQNYGIHYEYTIPVNQSTENQSEPTKPQDALFLWTHSGWEGCSVQCGGGERRTIVSCTRIVNKTTTLVNDSDCPQASRPEPQVRRCNSHTCQSRWVAGQWSPCSATCEKGIQHREVTCVYQLQNGTHVTTRPIYCSEPRPTPVQSCEGQDCLSIWEASEWSECSANCGKGIQKRTVTCTNSQGKCDASTRPKAEEACEDYSGCYEWKTGDWSKCSSTCGKGLQSRVVQCMHKVTGRHGSECPTLSKPAAYRQCHQEVCNEKINVNTITSPRLAALTYKCTRDQWTVYCRVIREKDLCQDMRWYQRCCQTCRDFYENKMRQPPSPPSS